MEKVERKSKIESEELNSSIFDLNAKINEKEE